MTITYAAPEPVDLVTMRISWTSDAASPQSFRVYLGGVLIATQEAEDGTGSIDVAIPPGDEPFLEVLDSDSYGPTLAFPGRITLAWDGVSGAGSYRIEEYVSAVWTERQEITDRGEGAFLWVSRWLEDCETHQFRIVPIGTDLNEGTPLAFSFEMVRHPNTPSVDYVLNLDGTLTVSVA